MEEYYSEQIKFPNLSMLNSEKGIPTVALSIELHFVQK